MTRDDVKKLLMVIQSYYPNFNVPNKTLTINAWFRIFSEYDYDKVLSALDAYVRTNTSGFAPSVGEIIEVMQKMFGGEIDNESSAWEKVWIAIKRSGAYAEEDFENFPPAIQRVVGSPNRLREWGMTQNFNESVESSNFKRAYRQEIHRESEFNRMNLNIKKIESKRENQKYISEKHEIHNNNCSPAPENLKETVIRIMNGIIDSRKDTLDE